MRAGPGTGSEALLWPRLPPSHLCPGPPAPAAGGLPQCCAPCPRSEARTGGRGARDRQEQSESLQEGPSTGATRRQSSMQQIAAWKLLGLDRAWLSG